MKSITIGEAKEKMKWLGLINLTTNEALSFAGFKKRVDTHQYGRGRNPYRIYFIHNSRDNIFGFYPTFRDTKENELKEVYQHYLDMVHTSEDENNITLPTNGNIQWGNCGIPISYSNLRVA